MAAILGNLTTTNAALAFQTDSSATGSTQSGSCFVNLTGTWAGTIAFQASPDGINWVNVAAFAVLTAGLIGAPVLSTTANGAFVIPVYGYQAVRVIATTYTSGTVQVSVDGAYSAPVGQVYANTEGLKASYFGSLAPLATASGATDIACLIGSATKTIRVTQVTFSMTQTTAAAYFDVQLIKRVGGTESAVNTAWSSTNAGPFDSADAALTAGGGGFTANPASLGTAVGVVASQRYFAALTGTAAPTTQAVWQFGLPNTRAIVLRGVNQLLALSLNTGAANVGVADVTFWWSEE